MSIWASTLSSVTYAHSHSPAIIVRGGISYLAGVNSGSDEDNECDCDTTDQYARLSYYYKSFIIPTIGSSENDNEFDNLDDFEGWNCGKITTCGKHQFCGGYNIKGKGSDITKTFNLPAGTYSVQLDFIKIDSW